MKQSLAPHMAFCICPMHGGNTSHPSWAFAVYSWMSCHERKIKSWDTVISAVLRYRLEQTELYEKSAYQSSHRAAAAVCRGLCRPGVCDMKKVAQRMLELLGGAGGNLISPHWHRINVNEGEKRPTVYNRLSNTACILSRRKRTAQQMLLEGS